MRLSARWLLLAISLTVGVLTVSGYLGLSAKINTGEFKAFAEAKAGELLNARVRIQKIQLRSLTKVSLSGLEIESLEGAPGPYRLKVQQIIFRYRIFQILSRNFQAPAGVVFKSPNVIFNQPEFPYPLFESLPQDNKAGPSSSFELNGGKIGFQVPSFDADIVFKDIKGSFIPVENGKLQAQFTAVTEGLLIGKVGLKGTISPLEHKHNLTIDLSGLAAGEKFPFGLKDISGTLIWKDDSLIFDSVTANLQGWKTELKGKLDNYRTAPHLVANWGVITKFGPLGADFDADWGTNKISGILRIPERPAYDFEGLISRQSSRFIAEEVLIAKAYRGGGELNWKSGRARFFIEKGRQRVAVDSDLKDFHFDLDLKFDHLIFYGLDIVTSGSVHLTPVVLPAEGPLWKFQADFRTGYFIVGNIPFSDFRGHFDVTPLGLKNISASWGDVFDAKGEVSFNANPISTSATVRVHEFDLANVKEFREQPLNKQLGGSLEGKLKINGPLIKPEFNGVFNVKDGLVGNLTYDRAIVQFRGFPPYLPLSESKVLKGRTTLPMSGAIDLTLENPFHGIQVETPDKIVVWKGLEINTSHEEKDVQIETPFAKLPTILLKAGNPTKEGEKSQGQEGAKPAPEKFVGVGTKIKF